MSETIRLIIVEDQIILRDSLSCALDKENDIEVVASLADASELVAVAAEAEPNMVLMDICTENGSSGIDATRELMQQNPDIKVVLMTGLPDLSFIDEARQAGAFSFVYKNTHTEELISILRNAMKNYATWPVNVDKPMLGYEKLNEREVMILRLFCSGKSRKDIARLMNYSENTIKAYIRGILSKTHYDSMAQLAVYAIKQGYISPINLAEIEETEE